MTFEVYLENKRLCAKIWDFRFYIGGHTSDIHATILILYQVKSIHFSFKSQLNRILPFRVQDKLAKK